MFKIKNKIYWVGVRDWEIKKFHGEEYSTHRGSTYNSYLVRDQKTALVDTVWTPFAKDFVEQLENHVGLRNIDLIVVNHTEQDHAGSLPYIMERNPDIPVYCTKNGANMIKAHFHKHWNFKIVKTGDTVDLGDYKLVFVEMPMLHWPDSMATYVSGANVLFSNDAFGQHYASPFLFDDEVAQDELYQEAIKYYANILTPFSRQVKSKIKEIEALKIPIDIIAPSHGIIWRSKPLDIIKKYNEWSDNFHEGTATILYNTMWGATRKMAQSIAAGLEKGGIPAKLINLGKSDKSDVVTEIFKSKGVLLGSSTINRGILSASAEILEIMRGLKFNGKAGASFGSYGWSGESPGIIEERLAGAGINIIREALKIKYNPGPQELDACESFGEQVAGEIKKLGNN